MSSVEEKTSTASPDQGATGEEEVSQKKHSRVNLKSGETPKKKMKKKKETLGKWTSLHQGEMLKKIKAIEGEAVMKHPTLRIGYKVQMPANKITIDNYDAWFDAVECGDHKIKPLELRKEEYHKIMAECFAEIDSGNVNVPNVPVVNDGVIDLDDYIEQIKQEDRAWADRYSIQYL